MKSGALLITLVFFSKSVAANNNSVNVWVIVLPVTGIALVGLFAIFCICRYTCRFISFCTKQCEKGQKKRKRPVSITMPSHNNIHELLLMESNMKERRMKPSAPECISADDSNSECRPVEATCPNSNILLENEDSSYKLSNIDLTDCVDINEMESTSNNNNPQRIHKGPKYTPLLSNKGHLPKSLEQPKNVVNDEGSSSEPNMISYEDANNEISEVSLPHTTIISVY